MTIPFEPVIFGIKINVHLVLEYLAFFIAFRYYTRSRKSIADKISNKNRLSIILGAIAGAFIGSRLVGFLENPLIELNANNVIHLLNAKSIMGGLFGGLLGVELSKKIIGEKQSSGDLFTYPIIIGIMIGRVGCFLSGTKEFTYGSITNFFTGMNLGDGYLRHPTSLYEILFLILLWIFLKQINTYTSKENGLLFKVFMISYFGFRFLIEFIKPNVFYIVGLSSIQWLCVICWVYYLPTFNKIKIDAH
ncbi:prolipoprotein diacylglyceryl transferase [soil metagenome]